MTRQRRALLQCGKWSTKYDCCQACSTTKRPHMCRGFCDRCYNNVRYHENRTEVVARRKLARLRAPIEKTQAAYAKQREWKKRNEEHTRAYQAAWHQRNQGRLTKWPVGTIVYIHVADEWRKGEIIDRPARNRAIVKVHGFGKHDVGVGKAHNLRKEKPIELAQVPTPVLTVETIAEAPKPKMSPERLAYMRETLRHLIHNPTDVASIATRFRLREAANVTDAEDRAITRTLRARLQAERRQAA